MFESITKKRKNPIYNIAGWALLAITSLIFVFVGFAPDVGGMATGTSVAQVNSDVISYTDFNRAVERAQESRQAKMTSDERKRLNQDVVNSLVHRSLILQSAKKEGILVGEEEVRDFLKQVPQFQDNGVFSVLRYKELVRAQGMSEGRFEEKIVDDMVVQKMNSLYMKGSSDNELIDAKEDALSKIQLNVQFVRKTKADLVSDKEVAKDALDRYMADNKSKIEKYYNDHPLEYTQKGAIQAQHILVRISPQVTAEQGLKKIKEVRAQANDKNFGELAKKFSEDPGSKDKNGELPPFWRNDMVKEFSDAVFGMKTGEISEPVQTTYGYHIIKLNGRSEEKQQSLDEVRTAIATKLYKEDKVLDTIADIEKLLKEGDEGIKKLFAQKGWSWDETGLFGLNDMMVPKLGDQAQVINAAMSLNKQHPIYDKVIESSNTYFIVKLKDLQAGTAAPKNAMNNMDFFKQMMQQQKSYESFQAWMDQLKKSASIKINQQVLNN